MLDAELGTDESRELHKEIRHNPAMQSEWNILQQTKLDPADSIEFPHKASLYHHTAGRVVSIRFLRMAAAAAIIGFGIYLGISALEKRAKRKRRWLTMTLISTINQSTLVNSRNKMRLRIRQIGINWQFGA